MHESISFDISLASKNEFVSLLGHAKGSKDLHCYKCGSNFNKDIDIALKFLISDGVYDGENENVMYEAKNSTIDLEEIAISELNILESDYNCCTRCNNDNSVFVDI